VADAILAQGALTHYDRPRVAMLCEKAGLYMRALTHYSELKDVKRVVVNSHAIDPQASARQHCAWPPLCALCAAGTQRRRPRSRSVRP
jgi:hypothetical protein